MSVDLFDTKSCQIRRWRSAKLDARVNNRYMLLQLAK